MTNPIITYSQKDGIDFVTINGRTSRLRDNGSGYLYTSRAGKKGTTGLHRILMELILGRELQENEHVHHIDSNKKNNDISNLELVDGREHNKEHTAARNLKHDPASFVCSTCKDPSKKHKANNVCGNCYARQRRLVKQTNANTCINCNKSKDLLKNNFLSKEGFCQSCINKKRCAPE